MENKIVDTEDHGLVEHIIKRVGSWLSFHDENEHLQKEGLKQSGEYHPAPMIAYYLNFLEAEHILELGSIKDLMYVLSQERKDFKHFELEDIIDKIEDVIGTDFYDVDEFFNALNKFYNSFEESE